LNENVVTLKKLKIENKLQIVHHWQGIELRQASNLKQMSLSNVVKVNCENSNYNANQPPLVLMLVLNTILLPISQRVISLL